jgi:N,N-dimethylformamidase
MKTIAGYTDRISARPGETIAFKVSVEEGPATYRASLVRLFNVDSHRDGPGLQERPVPAPFAGEHRGRRQEIPNGSWVRFPAHSLLEGLGSFSLEVTLWPTAPPSPSAGRGRQVLASTLSPDAARGFAVELDATGALALRLGTWSVSTGVPLLEREWATVGASYDAGTGSVHLWQRPRRRYPLNDTAAEISAEAPRGWRSGGLLSLAACRASAGMTAHYNGKLEAPRLTGAGGLIGAWDFARDIASERVTDSSPNAIHGETVNLPLRAMTGAAWTGEWHDWRAQPAHYAAIHFHDDDLADCGWQTDFTYTVPHDLPSGLYAARLENGQDAEHVVFYVRPPKGRRGSDAVFLASTATYMAYGNYRVMNRSRLYEMYLGVLPELVPSDLFLNERPQYGDSLYSSHSDGSGNALSTRLRPIVNMRPETTLSAFNDDGFLLGWLDHIGQQVDVVTDEDLHREGASALDGYRVLLTGNHPEYTSTAMWDAIRGFVDRGGRLLYLGGNGFFWRVAWHPTLPVIELRRAEDGSRPWESQPGEYYMAWNGEYGGMWRRGDRTPNQLVGTGFAASGLDIGKPFRRRPESENPRAAFIFEGIGRDEIIGDFGLLLGGAAGYEIDRWDRLLGSPPHALIVAEATGFTDNMVVVKEDMPATNWILGGVDNPLVRADMTFFETPTGGAVFSASSISWSAALPCHRFDNNVARITANVLRRFLDPAPFTPEIPR